MQKQIKIPPKVDWRTCEREAWALKPDELALLQARQKLTHMQAEIEALFAEVQLVRAILGSIGRKGGG